MTARCMIKVLICTVAVAICLCSQCLRWSAVGNGGLYNNDSKIVYQFNYMQVFVAENDVHYLRTTERILDCTIIVQPRRVRALTWCASICNKHLACEVFGYASSTQLCRLAGALLAPSDLNSRCATNETVFRSALGTPTKSRNSSWYFNPISVTCMMVFLAEKTHGDAVSVCAELQARLITCSCQEIIDVVNALVEDSNTGWQGNGGGIWVDAALVNDMWQWKDGSTWFNWSVGEPNMGPSNYAKCVQLYRDGKQDVERDYHFDDLFCSYAREFACEKPLV